LAQDASATSVSAELALAYTAFRSGAEASVHNEAAFRHFLAIERRRAELAGRSVLLVLVSLRTTPGRSRRLTPHAAGAIFAALGSSVRDGDFVGWFRDGHVAAAAVIQRGRPQPDAIVARIGATLRRELRDVEAALRLRAVALGRHSESR
jgi:hypothetical protein